MRWKTPWGDVGTRCFAGHFHRYVSYQRAQNKYYQLATTGGMSSLNGPLHGRFDHVTWVTLTRDGTRGGPPETGRNSGWGPSNVFYGHADRSTGKRL